MADDEPLAGRSPLGVSHWLPHRPFALESRGFLSWPSALHPNTLFLALLRPSHIHTYLFYLWVRRAVDSAHEMDSHDDRRVKRLVSKVTRTTRCPFLLPLYSPPIIGFSPWLLSYISCLYWILNFSFLFPLLVCTHFLFFSSSCCYTLISTSCSSFFVSSTCAATLLFPVFRPLISNRHLFSFVDSTFTLTTPIFRFTSNLFHSPFLIPFIPTSAIFQSDSPFSWPPFSPSSTASPHFFILQQQLCLIARMNWISLLPSKLLTLSSHFANRTPLHH